MYIPHSFTGSLVLMLLGMVGWGSWANAYKITPHRRFELFYWDYVSGIFLTAVIGALTLGSLFGHPTALEDLRSGGADSMLYALLAGVILNCGNILLTAALSVVGMAVAFPIALGLSIVVSTVLSYSISPRGNPMLLIGGVVAVLVAVIFSSMAYRSRGAEASTKPSPLGVLLAVAAGILFCGFAPLVTKAFACTHPLGPYSAGVFFTLGAFLSTFPLMAYFMRHPIAGPPIPASAFFQSTAREHGAGLLGGFIWGMGTVLTFAAAGYVGMALAGAIGQANSLVAALWGVFVWREFRGTSLRTKLWLTAMFVFYIGGIALIARSH